MLDREPFLKAIFAAPADDLPRLVFADWLDERGDPNWAELIRIGCRQHHPTAVEPGPAWDRGFRACDEIVADAELLADPDEFRRVACRSHPEWYGATKLKVTGGPVVSPTPLVTVLTSPVTEHVSELDLSGREEQVAAGGDDPGIEGGYRLIDFTRHPTVHPRMVDELARMRECRRLTVLDLRNNDLDNMALNALAESVYFTRLKRLRLSDGANRFRGRVWQRVLARFGEDVAE
jgi:uncharacterized protein (TIGR02996 family)